MDRPKVGMGVLVLKNDRVLFGKRKSSHVTGTWHPPGGHLEFGESLENCAKREVREETGIKIKNIRFATATNDIFEEEGKHYITLYMVADWESGEPQAEMDKLITDDLAQFDLFKNFIVSDYFIFKSLIFAQITLSKEEFNLYRKMFDIMYKEIAKPDIYVFLYQNTDRLLENIKIRGRDYEQNIQPDYLEKIHKGYLSFIKSQEKLNPLIIDVSDLDFVNQENDYQNILKQVLDF